MTVPIKHLIAAAVALLLAALPMLATAQELRMDVPTPEAPRVFMPVNFNPNEDLDNILYLDLSTGKRVTIRLMPGWAPNHVARIKELTRAGFYDGITFHRVIDGFMAQGGDPTGSGMGGPGYHFPNEDSDLTFDKAGVVAMANAGRDTNGSQFFITFGPAEYLNGGYTIFGQVISGMDVVNGLRRRDPQANPNYSGDAIESVSITEQ
jgi:cyclophilin family peptidyl-prolyl cis-trans isomerase